MVVKVNASVVANKFINELKVEIQNSDEKPKLLGILGNTDPAAKMYADWTRKSCEAIGIEFQLVVVERNKLEGEIVRANHDETVHGIMVYYPVFGGTQDGYLQNTVALEKDVEGLCHKYRYNMYHNIRFLDTEEHHKCIIPCTPLAIIKILEHIQVYNLLLPYGDRLHGRTVTIINRSEVVGRPLAALLANDGAVVYSCDEFGILKFSRGVGIRKAWHEVSETDMGMKEVLEASDVVITGVPTDGYKLDSERLRQGVFLVNFSTFQNIGPECQEKANIYVPSVGKVTVAMLQRNLFRLYRYSKHLKQG